MTDLKKCPCGATLVWEKVTLDMRVMDSDPSNMQTFKTGWFVCPNYTEKEYSYLAGGTKTCGVGSRLYRSMWKRGEPVPDRRCAESRVASKLVRDEVTKLNQPNRCSHPGCRQLTDYARCWTHSGRAA